MTTHKGFKRVVRARMAKTGERYAAARRALLADTPATASDGTTVASTDGMAALPAGYRFRGGLHPETATVANMLANFGVTSAITGQPLSEAAVLGIGGGLGAGYILWEFKAHHSKIITLGFRNRWQYPAIPGWLGTTAARLAVEATVHETSGAKNARDKLDAILARGEPVIAFVDQQSIGTWVQPATLSGYWGYQVVVAGRLDDGTYLVDDRGRTPLHVSPGVMAAARARIGSYKHRLIGLRPTDRTTSEETLRTAFRDGIADGIEHLSSPSDSFSLPAWRKWSRLMTDARGAKAWPRVFADRTGLFGALLSIVEGVDGDVGATGGHLRYLYADFLDEAALLMGRPAFSAAAAAWREAGDLWEDLADSAVPADLMGATEAVAAAEELNAAVMAGESGRMRASEAAQELWATRERYAQAFPLPQDRIDELFTDLGVRIGAIYDAERQALATTSSAAG